MLCFFLTCALAAQDMEAHASSFVSKARTAFNSAAAKAERVLMDFKIDRGEMRFVFFSLSEFLIFLNFWGTGIDAMFLIGEDSEKQFRDDFGRQCGDESNRSENESKV